MSDPSSETPPNGHAKAHAYDDAVRAMARTAAKLRRADESLIDQVRARPIASVMVALAAGYVLGRLLSRTG